MLVDVLHRVVPFLDTVGITALEAGNGRGLASIDAHRGVRSHTGSVHGAAVFGVAATAAEAAIVGVLAERLLPDGEGRSARAAVADADITYWRAARDTVVATAVIESMPGGEAVTADLLITRRNVSVMVDLADASSGHAIGRAGFHWVITCG